MALKSRILPHEGGALAQPKFYGRRQGRPLRKAARTLLQTRLGELLVDLPDTTGSLDMKSLFSFSANRYALEIGFGGGEHLAWQAREAPDTAFLGAEIFLNGIAKLVREIDENNLQNIRICQNDARLLMQTLPDSALDTIYVLFPDPWPKARHNKRRIIQKDTLKQMARILKPGGSLRIATDDAGYQHWILQHLLCHPDFSWQAEKPAHWLERPADWPATRYGEKALREGRTPYYLRYRRR